MTHSGPHPRRSFWSIALWLGVPAVVIAFMGLSWFALVRRERQIEAANVERIPLGMTQAELWELLGGAPDYEKVEFGLVSEPDSFATNSFMARSELARLGFRDYRFQQWTTPRLTVVVISDTDGGVVSRYFPGGQDLGWFDRLWFVVSGKSRRPPARSGVPETSTTR